MQVNRDAAELEEPNCAAHAARNYSGKLQSACTIFLEGRALSRPKLGRHRGRPSSYSVVAVGISFEIRRRIGSMWDSKKPWRLKKFWDRSSGRSVSSVIRRNFFCFAKLIAYSSNCEP